MKNVAVFSGSKVEAGVLEPGKKVWSIAIFGGSEVDFRQAELEEGVTEVAAFSLFGGNKILVPKDIQVTLSGFSLFGAKELKRSQTKETPTTSNKTIHVSATSIFGACEVTDEPKES